MDVKIRRGKQSTEYNGVSLWNFWKKPRVREIGYVLILVRDWSDWWCVLQMLKLEEGRKLLNILFSMGSNLIYLFQIPSWKIEESGDAVGILSFASPYPMSAKSLDRNMIEATVTGINPMILRLQDKGNVNLHEMETENFEGNIYIIDKLHIVQRWG